MPHRNLTVEEFARYIGVDSNRVRKMAERGLLPGDKLGGSWRFNQTRVHEWLQEHLLTLDRNELLHLERALFEEHREEWTDLIVTDLIGVEGVDLDIRAHSRASVLSELVAVTERTGLVYDPHEILKEIQERESASSTAVEFGIAVPHPRHPLPYATAEPLICVGRVRNGVIFGAPDGSLTNLFFLVLDHEERHYLHVLARLMRMLDRPTIGMLMDAEEPEQVLEALITREKEVVSADLKIR